MGIPITILIVDDDARLTAALKRGLADHQVVSTDSSDRAVQLTDTTRFDAVLLDLKIGKESGLALAQRIRVRSPSLTIGLMTGHPDFRAGVQAGLLGISTVFEKPVPLSAISAWIETRSIGPRSASSTLHQVKQDYISHVLESCGGNKSEAARRLGIRRTSLQRLLLKKC